MPSIVSHVKAADGTDLLVRAWPSDRLEAGTGAPAPWASVLLVHGLGEHSGRFEHVGDQLTAAGLAVWAYDHRGMGGSGGRRGDVERWSLYHDDLAERLADVRASASGRPVVLYSHSLGSLIAAGYLLTPRPKPDIAVLSSPALDSALPGWKKRIAGPLARVAPTAPIPNGIKGDTLSRDPSVGAEDGRRSALRQDQHGSIRGAGSCRAGARAAHGAGRIRDPDPGPPRPIRQPRPGVSLRDPGERARASSVAPSRTCVTSCTTSPEGPEIVGSIITLAATKDGRRAPRHAGRLKSARDHTPIGWVAGGVTTGRVVDGWRNVRQASSSTAPNPNRLAIAPTNGTRLMSHRTRTPTMAARYGRSAGPGSRHGSARGRRSRSQRPGTRRTPPRARP